MESVCVFQPVSTYSHSEAVPLQRFPKDEFINQLEIVVTKKKAMTIKVDEQWASEKEMRDDLKWSPLFSRN